jgi:hypothetical protein
MLKYHGLPLLGLVHLRVAFLSPFWVELGSRINVASTIGTAVPGRIGARELPHEPTPVARSRIIGLKESARPSSHHHLLHLFQTNLAGGVPEGGYSRCLVAVGG